MKKVNIIKKNQDFSRIIKKNKSYKTKQYIIYIERVNQDKYHFGISISKKIGNAVTRNKIKRQIKNIIDKKQYKNNFNCIIIVRKEFLKNEFINNEKILLDIFNKHNLYLEEKDEK